MRFTIITVNYNDIAGLRRTIESVASQTFIDYEHIVIDGGSFDGSVDVIKENSEKFCFWRSEPDQGTYDAMNIGVRYAHGDYINFMNSGDVFHSTETLKRINKILDNADIITGNSFMPEINKTYINPYKNVTLLTLLKHPLSHQSIFYKREIFDHYSYDTKLKMMADFKLNLQAIVLNDCSVKITQDIVSDFDINGISSENPVLYHNELQHILYELFPRRIITDYQMMETPEEIPLVKLLPQLRNTNRVQKIVYYLAKFLLKIAR